MSTPPQLVADRYRLVKLVGAGGMGVVWQAWDERLHRPVALKMLRTQPETTEADRQLSTDRAMREARITAGLHHPHAVTVYDVVEHEGQPCIVMQLVDSTPLSELLRENGAVTPEEAARIGAQAASALAAAHKLKIVHRDVKPGNILITADGSALISDFGIAHALGDATLTATGMIHGTPAYLAPEVARGQTTSFASDVFSLGSTLYTMVEGEPPFGTDRNSIALLHRVARGGYAPPKHAGPLGPLLRKMLATQPKRRPSMDSVVASLTALQGDEGPSPVILPDEMVEADTIQAETVEAETTDADATTLPRRPPVPPPAAPSDGEPEDATRRFPPTPPTVRLDPAANPDSTADAATKGTLPGWLGPLAASATAETERLGAAGAAGAATATAPSRVETAPPPHERRRMRAGVVAGILILLIGAAIAAVLLVNPLRTNPDSEAEPTPTQTRETSSPTQTPASEEPAPAPSPSEPPAEEEPEPTPPAAPITAEQRVVDAISGYYAMMPASRDEAWPRMTADYQENHAGGRGGYEAFWSQIDDVEVSDVSATGPDTGRATLTYYFSDGRVIQEVTTYRFVEEEGVLKIAASDVVSSRTL